MNNLENSRVWHLIISRGLASLGATLTSFGIDVWFYQKTGSYSDFALIGALTTLPPIVISPIAGFLTDRASKPKMLLLSELLTVSLLTFLGIFYLLEALGFFVIAACVFLLAVVGEFRYTAMMALIPEITSKESLTSINGIQQAFRGMVIIVGPLLGAVGYKNFGLTPLLGAAILTSLYAAHAARMLMPPDGKQPEQDHTAPKDFISDYIMGLRWLNGEPKLKAILLHFTFINGFIALFGTLIIPHILDIRDESWLAIIIAAQGAGLLAGGIILANIAPLLPSEKLLFFGCHALGAGIMLFGLSDRPYVLTALALLIGVSISIVSASNQFIWQTCTPSQMQGKVIAIRSVMLYLSSPAAIYFSVPASNFLKAIGQSPETSWLIHGQRWSSILLILIGAIIFSGSLLTFLHWRSKYPGSTLKRI